MSDTIVALATPTGRSGIGVIRLSGEGSIAIGRSLTSRQEFSPRYSHLVSLTHPSSTEVIDEAIVTYFKAPNSFTGEDVIEISCHGSPVLLRQVIDVCLAQGARMAHPGEFSLRALANGRMNLAEAEAIRDLIDSQTVASARQAVRQLRGEYSHQLQPIKDELLDVIVILESALEFVEDDLPETQSESIKLRLGDLVKEIEGIAATFKAGKLIRDGLRVALVGRPNVGKSSLFNALLGSDRAIVTEIPGTTRDQIHERFTIGDIPISLIDTAGLRDTTDMVESIGVERSRRTMADADIVLVLLDAAEDLTAEDEQIIDSVRDLPHLIVLNKSDKPAAISVADLTSAFARKASNLWETQTALIVATSAKTGSGLDHLQQAIVEPFASQDASSNGFLVTDARHHDLLVRSADEVLHSIELLEQHQSEEIVLIGLHNALRYLGEITGETTTEDMLTRIFSTFCIGK
ncbi:MAG: tRNA uridine-5-carboxymethylaminomethyl(34) synthesis GTPase MnmE [bacterium]|nr:tRNA uridine-5-carboxymethylaminomethyl(34) synthesis GTPase MnmE [bacterium]